MTDNRLLVVDDEADFGEFVRDVGEGLGYEVVYTPRSTEFKELYRSFSPTVIVVDIVMPDIDGIELIQWLTAEGYTNKVVVVTGFNPRYAKMAELLAESHGVSEVITLTKPVSLADLRTAIS